MALGAHALAWQKSYIYDRPGPKIYPRPQSRPPGSPVARKSTPDLGPDHHHRKGRKGMVLALPIRPLRISYFSSGVRRQEAKTERKSHTQESQRVPAKGLGDRIQCVVACQLLDGERAYSRAPMISKGSRPLEKVPEACTRKGSRPLLRPQCAMRQGHSRVRNALPEAGQSTPCSGKLPFQLDPVEVPLALPQALPVELPRRKSRCCKSTSTVAHLAPASASTTCADLMLSTLELPWKFSPRNGEDTPANLWQPWLLLGIEVVQLA